MQRRKVFIGLAAVAAAGILVAAYMFDPMSGTFPYPRCLFKLLTGWDCPGCGSTRALHALLHGRPADAWSANPALFAAVPLAALGFVADRPGHSRLRRLLFSPAAVSLLVAATILWTLLRNLLCL